MAPHQSLGETIRVGKDRQGVLPHCAKITASFQAGNSQKYQVSFSSSYFKIISFMIEITQRNAREVQDSCLYKSNERQCQTADRIVENGASHTNNSLCRRLDVTPEQACMFHVHRERNESLTFNAFSSCWWHRVWKCIIRTTQTLLQPGVKERKQFPLRTFLYKYIRSATGTLLKGGAVFLQVAFQGQLHHILFCTL